jgi:hypothetical protein
LQLLSFGALIYLYMREYVLLNFLTAARSVSDVRAFVSMTVYFWDL